VYIYLYTYMYIYIYTYIHIYIYTYIHIYIYKHMHTHTYIHIYIYTYIPLEVGKDQKRATHMYCPTLWIMYKYLRASLADLSIRSWYKPGTKHFRLTILVRWESTTQQCWGIKPVPHNLVRRIRSWSVKSLEQDLNIGTER